MIAIVLISTFLETYVKEILITATKWVAASEEKLAYICKEKLHRATHHNQYVTDTKILCVCLQVVLILTSY